MEQRRKLKTVESTFQQQNDVLFENVINTFCNEFKKPYEQRQTVVAELFLTPTCNQNCTYCYLQKNKEQLYPAEINKKSLILKNTRILLDYFLEQGYVFDRFDLYSGEIWGYPFSIDILKLVLDYIDKGLKINVVCIPTNASFCFSPELTKIMSSMIQEFERRGSHLNLSLSYDGIVVDQHSRPISSKQNITKDEAYLKNLGNFIRNNYCGFHPMIDSDHIELQIENYKEWLKFIDTHKPYKVHPFENYGIIMQLETRQQGWTDAKITEYLKWLKFLIDTDLHKFFDDNLEDFHDVALAQSVSPETHCKKLGCQSNGWSPYMPYRPMKQTSDLGCSLGRTLTVRMGDLAIIPCHRTSYPKFILGKYELDEAGEKIIGMSCNNFPLTSGIFVTGFLNKPKCGLCALNETCLKYCIGANYEASKELFDPEESNCNLQKAKHIFLYEYYKKLGVKNIPILTVAYQKLKLQEPEVVQKWSTIVQSIICSN